jgi:exodeoxyribonuclease VII small subunit
MSNSDVAAPPRQTANGSEPGGGAAPDAGASLDLSYGDAMAELDTILADLESSAVDVDTLAAKVARGATLVRFCRDRLDRVQTDVGSVVSDLIGDAAPGGEEPGERAEAMAPGDDEAGS